VTASWVMVNVPIDTQHHPAPLGAQDIALVSASVKVAAIYCRKAP